VAAQAKTEIPPTPPTEDPYATRAPHGETTQVMAQPEWPTIPGYQILGELGRGGMGVVYKARQLSLQRLVALKMVRTGPFASAEERHRFHLEAEVVAKLHHPNIVQIFEVGELSGQAFLVLELIEGHSLQRKMGAAWRPQEAAQLMETLARAMHYAHEHGIVHRDLKPANILIHLENWGSHAEDQGERDHAPTVTNLPTAIPKITDFGLAKLMAPDSVGPTVTGDFLGTPTYSAPEQAAGKIRDIGPHTDVYSLGAILYELLTGRPPFQGATILETLDQVRTQEPTSLSRLQKKVPRDLETICLKCLQKDPRKRYANALLFAEDLGRYLTGQPIQARRIGMGERLVKWARRRPAMAALIAVSALAALGLGIGGWWSALQLSAAAQREAKEKHLAQENLSYSVDAVERMLNDVAAVDLAEVPQMEAVRKKVLLQAQEFYDKFLQNPGRGPQVPFLAGRAKGRLGDIYDMLEENAAAETCYREALDYLTGDEVDKRRELARVNNNFGLLLKKLGRYPEAEKALQQALDLRQRLAKEYPDQAEYGQDLAATLYNRATVLAKLADRDKAKETYLEALNVQEELARAHPDKPDYRRDQARTLNNLGILFWRVEPPEAEKAFHQAIGIYKEIVNKNPNIPGYRLQLARSYNNLANMLQKREQVEKNFSLALGLLKQLAVDFPKVPLYRQQLAGIYVSIGVFHYKANRPELGDKAYQKALELRRKVAEESPGVPDYQHTLANLYFSLGEMLRAKGQHSQAADHYRQAVKLLERIAVPGSRPDYQSDLGLALNSQALVWRRQSQKLDPLVGPELVLETAAGNSLGSAVLAWHKQDLLLQGRAYLVRAISYQQAARKNDPQNKRFPELLLGHYNDLISIQLLLLDHEGVAQSARAIPPIYPDRAGEYVLAAECLARAIPLAQEDWRLTPQQRRDTVEKYAAEAICMLEAAIARGFSKLDELRTRPAYDPLRSRPDFQRLIEGMDKNKTRNV
jgi:tetratricopeptide (TPR) repeat protein